jgi:[ribosomal protein S18]-alanine N-acetyltransferase
MGEFIEAGAVTLCGDPPNGFLIVTRVLDEAEVIVIAVLPSARKTGLAEALIAASMGTLAQQGIKRMFLEVAQDNAAARSLYDKLGFSQIGLRKAYYARPNAIVMDALVLSRDLDPAFFVA